MITTIRTIGQPGLDRYMAFRQRLDSDGGKPRWKVEGQTYSGDPEWRHIIWADSEEHAMLAHLFLSEGGRCKVNGNILTDDLALPRRHQTDE